MICIGCDRSLQKTEPILINDLPFCQECAWEQHLNLTSNENNNDGNPNDKSLIFEQASFVTRGQPKVFQANQSQLSQNNTPRFDQSRISPEVQRSVSSTHKEASPSSPDRKETCQVCYEEKPFDQFLPLYDHQCLENNRTICDTCLYNHIEQLLENTLTHQIQCIESTCASEFSYDTISSIIGAHKNTKLLERYNRFLTLHQLEQLDEFIWCSNVKCQMGQLNEGGTNNNIVTCIRCHRKTCFVHKIPWHSGFTCDEYNVKVDVHENASNKWLNKHTKACPKCTVRIQKNNGCDHMTCVRCKYEFCWFCLADYNQIRADGNHRHHRDCKYYAPYGDN